MADKIPLLLKHMALAIFQCADLRGSTKERFVAALKIAKSRLVEYGHITTASTASPLVEDVTLTGSGRKLEKTHLSESGGSLKTKKFDTLYAKVKLAEAEQDLGKVQATTPGDQDAANAKAEQRRLKTKVWGK